jgi:hypothetical protein
MPKSLAEMWSCKLFAQGWSWTAILPTSASLVAGITDASHQHPTKYIFWGELFDWFFEAWNQTEAS